MGILPGTPLSYKLSAHKVHIHKPETNRGEHFVSSTSGHTILVPYNQPITKEKITQAFLNQRYGPTHLQPQKFDLYKAGELVDDTTIFTSEDLKFRQLSQGFALKEKTFDLTFTFPITPSNPTPQTLTIKDVTTDLEVSEIKEKIEKICNEKGLPYDEIASMTYNNMPFVNKYAKMYTFGFTPSIPLVLDPQPYDPNNTPTQNLTIIYKEGSTNKNLTISVKITDTLIDVKKKIATELPEIPPVFQELSWVKIPFREPTQKIGGIPNITSQPLYVKPTTCRVSFKISEIRVDYEATPTKNLYTLAQESDIAEKCEGIDINNYLFSLNLRRTKYPSTTPIEETPIKPGEMLYLIYNQSLTIKVSLRGVGEKDITLYPGENTPRDLHKAIKEAYNLPEEETLTFLNEDIVAYPDILTFLSPFTPFIQENKTLMVAREGDNDPGDGDPEDGEDRRNQQQNNNFSNGHAKAWLFFGILVGITLSSYITYRVIIIIQKNSKNKSTTKNKDTSSHKDPKRSSQKEKSKKKQPIAPQ